ncbi:MAG: CsgG/HfaB family protein [Phascolarctobacterium sp.]|nr:CsgG/HfaB family protein [Phascolarctobacterium sp.]
MKRFFVILTLMLSIAVSAFADKQIIAVWDIVNGSGNYVGNKVAQDFKAELTTALVNSGAFNVVERGQLKSVLREFSFQQSGMVDPATAVQIGKMSGAGLTFVGNVVTATVGHQDNFVYKSVKAKVKLNYKIIDNKTGVIKISEMVEGNSSVVDGQRVNTELLMYNAVKEAVEKVTAALTELNPVSACVIRTHEKWVYINVGSENGVKVGDMYGIYSEGNNLVDPVTGDILGTEEFHIDNMKIIKVMPKYSIGVRKNNKRAVFPEMKVRRIFGK